MLSKIFGLLLLCHLFPSTVFAQGVKAPALRPGDSWLFQQTLQNPKDGWKQARFQLEISRVSPSRIYFSAAKIGVAQPPLELIAGLDWSMSKSVNGVEAVVSKPFDFPLSLDKSWKFELEEKENLGNDAHKAKNDKLNYRVVGMENIDVPAGRFKAWKIEAEGSWTETRPPAISTSQQTQAGVGGAVSISVAKKTGETTVTGRIYEAVWYAPEVKYYVKQIKERFDPSGVRYFSEVKELVSFKEAPLPSND